jgi:hypothetical protein
MQQGLGARNLLEVLRALTAAIESFQSTSIQDKTSFMPIDQYIIYGLHIFVWNGHVLKVIMNFHFHPAVRSEGQGN